MFYCKNIFIYFLLMSFFFVCLSKLGLYFGYFAEVLGLVIEMYEECDFMNHCCSVCVVVIVVLRCLFICSNAYPRHGFHIPIA